MKKSNPSTDQQSTLGLERHHTLFDKLFLTVALLFLGPLLGVLFFAATSAPTWQPPWSWIVQQLLNALGVFYVLLVVFVWWRPDWLRRHYVAAERKVIRGVYIFFGCAILYTVGCVAYQSIVDALQ